MKIFLLFLTGSGLAWFISNLSETYEGTTSFYLNYVNAPDSLLLEKAFTTQVDVRLRAVGFQFLLAGLRKKTVQIDLSQIRARGSQFHIPPGTYQKQIERQLSRSMTLISMDQDTLFLTFHKLRNKTIPVKVQLTLGLAQNHILDGTLELGPDSIILHGPEYEIQGIDLIKTEPLVFENLMEDFSRNVTLQIPPELVRTELSSREVVLSGKVVRFSEKLVTVPIQVVHLPEDVKIRTFPDKVEVLCKAKVDVLRAVEGKDFQVIADYNDIQSDTLKTLSLQLLKKPKGIYSADLMERKIEYILRRE
ncbi:MAG: YbbR-like domain-containing protein [Bacteroidota bacterium]